MEITENSKTLKFDANGLIPAIVQDHYTKEVLTLAYMNAETLALTIAEGRTVFWSRSRQEIWRKGETSGNVQRVVSITADCDKDALVVDVIKSGPACHTGAESCFFNPVYVSDELKQFTWQGLYELIEGRKTNPKEGSYTTYLFDKGLEKILKKVGEESTEVIIAGSKRDKEETVYEISDLAYHVMVLMIELGISKNSVSHSGCSASCSSHSSGIASISTSSESSYKSGKIMAVIISAFCWMFIGICSFGSQFS